MGTLSTQLDVGNEEIPSLTEPRFPSAGFADEEPTPGITEADRAWANEMEVLDDLQESGCEKMALQDAIFRLRDSMLADLPAGTEVIFDRHQVWGKHIGDSWGVVVTLPGMLMADAITAHGLDALLVAASALAKAKLKVAENKCMGAILADAESDTRVRGGAL